METKNVQSATFLSLVMRGYANDLTPEALLARQVCKLLEEACETAMTVKGFSPDTLDVIDELHELSRRDFDDITRWQKHGGILSMREMRKELADDYVTIANAAEASERVDGKPFDVALAGLEKSEADVRRGVRNGGK